MATYYWIDREREWDRHRPQHCEHFNPLPTKVAYMQLLNNARISQGCRFATQVAKCKFMLNSLKIEQTNKYTIQRRHLLGL